MPNALTYLGPAISGAGSNLSQFGNEQEALRERLQQMTQMRLDKANEENRQNAELTLQQNQDKRAQQESDRKEQDQKDQDAADAEVMAGNPGTTTPGQVLLGPSSDLQPVGTKTPDVTSPSTPKTRDQVLQIYLKHGRITPDKYLEYTKGDPNQTLLPIALNELSTIVQNNPADTKKGLQARNAATTALRAKYPMLNGQEGFEKSIGDALKSETSPVINIGMGVRTKGAIENNIRGINAAQVKPYQLIRNAAINFMNDYNDYKTQGAKAGNNRQATLGMIDKFITASTGKATGQAQFLESTGWQGYVTELNKLRDQAANGDLTGPEAVEQMKRITLSNAESMRKQARLANANSDEMVAAENSNPENIAAGIQLTPAATHTIGEAAHAADSTFYANANPPATPDKTGGSTVKTKSGKSYIITVH